MTASLYMLRDFFATGRKPNGCVMGENENLLNATQRNLSCLTDDELAALRDSAKLLIGEIDATLRGRWAEDDNDEPLDDGPDQTDPGYWLDNR